MFEFSNLSLVKLVTVPRDIRLNFYGFDWIPRKIMRRKLTIMFRPRTRLTDFKLTLGVSSLKVWRLSSRRPQTQHHSAPPMPRVQTPHLRQLDIILKREFSAIQLDASHCQSANQYSDRCSRRLSEHWSVTAVRHANNRRRRSNVFRLIATGLTWIRLKTWSKNKSICICRD